MGILKAVDLPAHLIKCIAACITTPKFSVSINGGLEGYFSGGKGLKDYSREHLLYYTLVGWKAG